MRTAVWTGDTRDTQPKPEVRLIGNSIADPVATLVTKTHGLVTSRAFCRVLSDIEAVVWMLPKDLIDCVGFLSAPDIHEADLAARYRRVT